jgi:CHAT domain-containing protein
LANETTAQQAMTQGSKAFQVGDFTQAIQHWQQAAQLYAQLSQPVAQSQALTQQAEAYQRLGFYPEAINQLATALALVESPENKELKVSILANLGYLCATLNESPTEEEETKSHRQTCQKGASSYIKDGLNLAEGNDALMALMLINQGNISALKKQPLQALANYRQAAQRAERAGKVQLLSKALNNAATITLELEDRDTTQSEAFLTQTVAQLKKLPESHDKVYALLSCGVLARQLDGPANWQRAYDFFQQARQIAHRLSDKRAESYTVGYLGELYEATQRLPEALQLTQQAIFLAQQLEEHELLLRWYRQSGRIQKARGEIDKAITAYYHAVEHLEVVRQDMESCRQRGRSSFQESIEVYRELVDLLLQRAAAHEKDDKPIAHCEPVPQPPTLKTKEDESSQEEKTKNCEVLPLRGEPKKQVSCDLRNAQIAAERFKDAELRDYFQEECVTGVQTCPITVDHQLPARQQTAVIYPIVLPDRVVVLLDLPNELRQIPLGVKPGELTNYAKALARDLSGQKEFHSHAVPLYEWLIRPLEPYLTTAIDTLVWIPDGALRTIPFAALYDQSQQQFLIKKYAIATTQGLNLTDARSFSRQPRRLLLNGLSETNPDYPNYLPLKQVEEEIKAIQHLYQQDSDVLLNKDFVPANLKRELLNKSYSVVFIASHAEFQNDLKNTFILTYKDRLTMDQLEDSISLGRVAEKMPITLLTLSACETAVGNERAALGLAGVAIKAGAHSVLASLWQVDDKSTALLMERFYAILKNEPDLPKVKVLQRAQWHLLKEYPDFAHPYYWSPFLLIGNWL